jgi:glyoxylase-like metal-dependent hydrolase (beta-lactamase superfamily II)
MLPSGVIVFERGWLSANNVLLIGKGPTALVDSGYCTHSAQTVGLVQGALQGRRLEWLLNTHLHSDHCGGNAALQAAFPDLQTRVPAAQFDAVRRWDPVALTYEPTGQLCPMFQASGVLRPGEAVQLGDCDWEVHGAPGHDPHSIVLFEPASRTLISADALWSNGFGVVFPELEGETGFDEVGRTLDVIEHLRPATVIPGHGPVFTDVPSALAQARRRLDGFLQNPVRHAKHAARVLVKFKLLERQQIAAQALIAWITSTRYFQTIHGNWFGEEPINLWAEGLIDDLVRSNAAVLAHGVVVDK